MTVTSLGYVSYKNGLTYYDFERIDNAEICKKIEQTCEQKAASEKQKAVMYTIASIALSILFNFSFLNAVTLVGLTIYVFSSDARKKSEHYTHMMELAGLYYAQLNQQKNRYY